MSIDVVVPGLLILLLVSLIGTHVHRRVKAKRHPGRTPKKASCLSCLVALAFLFVIWIVVVLAGGRIFGLDARG